MEKNSFAIQSLQDLMDTWEKIKDRAPFNADFFEIRCKHCHSSHISKYGFYKNVQLWWCQQCKRKFTGSKAPPGMKISLEQIQSALSMYFKGVPLSSIRKQLEEEFRYSPSDSTIHRWIHQFTVKVFKDTQNLLPQVGDTWVAFESTIRIGSKQYWISDIIDAQTHFLLASRLSASRKIEDIRVLIELAEQKARKIPARLITRRPSKYLKGADQALGLDCSKVQITRPEKGHEIKFSVHWHHILNGRSSIARNLKSLDTAQLVLKGWIDDYNYYSPQRALRNRTPAQVAGIDYKYATMVN